MAGAHNNNNYYASSCRNQIMNKKKLKSQIWKTLGKVTKAFHRQGDFDCAKSPEGISPEGWCIANDIAVAIRIASEDPSSEDHKILGAASMVITMQDSIDALSTLFPEGPNHLHRVVRELYHATHKNGFASILTQVAKVINFMEKH